MQSAQPRRRSRRITSREWLALGVLALDAAYKADSPTASEYYRTLAEKCDAQAETTPHLRLLP